VAGQSESQERYAYLKYVGHIAVMTGKIREAMSLKGIRTIADLIAKLDSENPGFQEVFMPPGGVFNSRTAIICRRAGQPSFGIIDEKEEIQDGDIVTFW
jgi:hypothetical protein